MQRLLNTEYDLIVVGSGFCGSVIANLAAKQNLKILLFERRSHIAGNMYDYMDSNGILVQKYGPHVLHTNNDEVAEYLFSLAPWRDFRFTYAVRLDDADVPAPFGFKTIDRYYDSEAAADLKQRLIANYPNSDSIAILDLLESNDSVIHSFAKMLYEKNYLPYALKQWQLPPEKLSDEIIGRMPVRLSDLEPYFQDKYQMLPANGFTSLFQSMLSSSNIDVLVKTDALDYISLDTENHKVLFCGSPLTIPLVYTGPLEDILNSEEKLPYRSLRIEFEQFDTLSYHDFATVTYPNEMDYLRTTDFAKFTHDANGNSTTVSFEYPTPYTPQDEKGNEPYYPILTKESYALNQKLQDEASKYDKLYPCGRLADFHYYNMDKAIERAFDVFKQIDFNVD